MRRKQDREWRVIERAMLTSELQQYLYRVQELRSRIANIDKLLGDNDVERNKP
jgi:hypothetical protein